MLLIHGEGRRYVQGSGWRGGGGDLLTPWVAVCAGWGGMLNTLLFSQVLLFAPGSLQVAVGFCLFFFNFLVSLYLCLELAPTTQAQNYFWGPCNFFAFCFWRRHVSMCKRCSKGSQVPVCFIIRRVCLIGPSSQKETSREGGQRGGSRLPSPRLKLQDRQVQGHWQGWEGKEREKRVR